MGQRVPLEKLTTCSIKYNATGKASWDLNSDRMTQLTPPKCPVEPVDNLIAEFLTEVDYNVRNMKQRQVLSSLPDT